MEKQKLIGPIDTIKKSWDIIGNNKKYVVKIFFISFLIYLVATIIFSLLTPSSPMVMPTHGPDMEFITPNPYVMHNITALITRNIIAQLAGTVVSIMIISFQTLAFLKLYDSQKLEVKELIKTTFGTLVTALLVMFLFYLIVGIGTILLVIPGIIFGLMFMFALPIAIEKGTKAIDSLKASKELTSGYKWGLFWKMLVSKILVVILYSLPLIITSSSALFSLTSSGNKQSNVLLVIIAIFMGLISLAYLIIGMFLMPGMNAMIDIVFYKDLLRIKDGVVQNQILEPTTPSPDEQTLENQDTALLAQETTQESVVDNQPVVEEQPSDSIESQ